MFVIECVHRFDLITFDLVVAQSKVRMVDESIHSGLFWILVCQSGNYIFQVPVGVQLGRSGSFAHQIVSLEFILAKRMFPSISCKAYDDAQRVSIGGIRTRLLGPTIYDHHQFGDQRV